MPPSPPSVADFAHVMFGGLTHAPAIRLAQRLVEITPAGLEHVFLADSGSVSVEVALKMTLQYQRGVDHPERTRLLTVRGGYHGDTFGAMSVCDPDGGMHSMFTDVLPHQVFADRPPAGEDGVAAWAAAFERTAAQHAHELAGDRGRAVAPGRRWHARLSGGVPASDARHGRPTRAAAGVRRDRDRLRAHRHPVRGGRRRRRAGHHVPGQGTHRRVPEPGRGVVHLPGGARARPAPSPAC